MTDLRLYRPPEWQRPTRRVRPIRQRIGELEWHPDTWMERLEAWEWEHPWASTLLALMALLVAVVTFYFLGVAAAP